MVCHRHGFGEALGFIVHAAFAHRVDVAPVVFGLRVNLRIAVHFAGAGQQEAGPVGLGDAQCHVCTKAANLQRLDGAFDVINRAGRAGEVHHVIDEAIHK